MSNDGKRYSISPGIAPGRSWDVVEAGHGLAASVFFYDDGDSEKSCRAREMVQVRAALIEEALNVHAETGLTPSQLVEAAKMLRAAAKRTIAMTNMGHFCPADCHPGISEHAADCPEARLFAALEATKAVGE